MAALTFNVLQSDTRSNARLGTLTLPERARCLHPAIAVSTPTFMPVGTLGTIKGLTPKQFEDMNASVMLANAYHLMLRPTDHVIGEIGGLHAFTGHRGGILTDSGGFQVYSLAALRKVHEDGVQFRSHIDGAKIDLTPERLVQVQENLAPNIAMVLDECPPATASREDVALALERTTRWAKRCLEARTRQDIAWFGITQGALYEDFRRTHIETLSNLPFDGFAVGGVSVGEAPEDIRRIVDFATPLLPRDKPRYLMGVGKPVDLVWGVAAGVDMFDCVLPSRNARNGTLYTFEEKISIKNSAHRLDTRPLDDSCDAYCCRTYSRAFLRHLYMSKEPTFIQIATLHNLRFYQRLMQRIREQLRADTFDPSAMAAALAHTS